MTSRFWSKISASGALLAATAAVAGLLPNPPFTTGGYNAPDANTLKQEQGVGKVITKYVGGRTKCDQKAVASLQKSSAAADTAGVTAAEVAWNLCKANANAKYLVDRDLLLSGGTPACLNAAGIDAIKTSLDAQLLLLGPLVYCDSFYGTNGVTQLNIPETAAGAKAEVSEAKTATKAGTGAGKCYTKAASTVFKDLGLLPPADLTKFNDCLTKANQKGLDAVAKAILKGTNPTCLTPILANGLVTAAVALGGSFNDETYCAP